MPAWCCSRLFSRAAGAGVVADTLACGHYRLGLLLPKEACRSPRCGVPAWCCSLLLSASSCIRCCHRHRHCRFTPATSDRPATVSRCRRRAPHRGGAQLTPAPARGLRLSCSCLLKATCLPPRCGAGLPEEARRSPRCGVPTWCCSSGCRRAAVSGAVRDPVTAGLCLPQVIGRPPFLGVDSVPRTVAVRG